ncbi:MAG TPA: hypothetical protein DCZ04_00150 [Syntrophorhabdus aromaticivorans]|nr:hypothetical protein [Syntrophorhabdus aromaticivorans]
MKVVSFSGDSTVEAKTRIKQDIVDKHNERFLKLDYRLILQGTDEKDRVTLLCGVALSFRGGDSTGINFGLR